jgi:hypothetical protein
MLQRRLVPAPKRGRLVSRVAEIVRRRKSEFAVGLSRQLYGLTIGSERPNHRMMDNGIHWAQSES